MPFLQPILLGSKFSF
uniref:Uncharacterized protein n=1 Tax=Arundo donax TaxID=35708 RepID=A0A0A8ZVC5_ARUDO